MPVLLTYVIWLSDTKVVIECHMVEELCPVAFKVFPAEEAPPGESGVVPLSLLGAENRTQPLPLKVFS